jgi:hypothetical protein
MIRIGGSGINPQSQFRTHLQTQLDLKAQRLLTNLHFVYACGGQAVILYVQRPRFTF